MSMMSVATSQRSVTRRLTRRYVLALVTIALLSVMAQVVVQITIGRLSRDTGVINIAALQRTLSERLSKAALAILVTPDAATQIIYVNELRGVVPQWEHTHLALQQGDAAMGLPSQNSPEVTRLFAQIAPSFNAMQDAATQLLAAIDSQPPILLPSTPSLQSVIAPYVQEILTA